MATDPPRPTQRPAGSGGYESFHASAAAPPPTAATHRSNLLVASLRAVRPKQWVKNLFVFAPLLFAKHLLDADLFLRSLAAFAVFATLAGAVYVLNDLFDVHKDREHPYKRLRPIASGALPIPAARILIVALVAAGGFGAFSLGWQFALVAGGYVTMNVAYTVTLKHFAFVDVLCIASGFLLRVVAGSLAIDVDISRWLLVCTFLLALFLALGKRKHEFVTLHQSGREARPVMERYQLQHLNLGLWCAGLLTLASYALYTFDPDTAVRFGTTWLPATIVFIAFGIVRFVKLIDLHDAESPTEEMLKDVPFIANGLLWATAVIVLIYTGNA